jgi:hypothetical protein
MRFHRLGRFPRLAVASAASALLGSHPIAPAGRKEQGAGIIKLHQNFVLDSHDRHLVVIDIPHSINVIYSTPVAKT